MSRHEFKNKQRRNPSLPCKTNILFSKRENKQRNSIQIATCFLFSHSFSRLSQKANHDLTSDYLTSDVSILSDKTAEHAKPVHCVLCTVHCVLSVSNAAKEKHDRSRASLPSFLFPLPYHPYLSQRIFYLLHQFLHQLPFRNTAEDVSFFE